MCCLSFGAEGREKEHEKSILTYPVQSKLITRLSEDFSQNIKKELPPFFTSSSWLFAQSETVDTFDPFVDYNEFQDNKSEQEGIDFLKNGRLLTIGLSGGYEAITLNMRQIYGDTLGTFGAFISFFFDLQFAFQLSTIFPRRHYFSILKSYPTFSSYNVDFKYYFSRQNLIKGIAFLNPYIIFGPFWIKVTDFYPDRLFPPSRPGVSTSPTAQTTTQTATGQQTPEGTPGATSTLPCNPQTDICPPPRSPGNLPTPEEQKNTKPHSKTGFKLGLGFEIPLFKKIFIGFEISYWYLPLPFEEEDLTGVQKIDIPDHNSPPPLLTTQAPRKRNFLAQAIEPTAPSNLRGKRFFGDMVNGIFIIGINF